MNYCDPEGFRNVIKSLAISGDKDAFFTWFDGGEDTDGAFNKAQDVFLRLFLSYAKKYLGDLKEKVSLDIGYGSGGQVLEASYHFKRSVGIDVHEEDRLVGTEMIERGGQRDDFALIHSNGYTIPVDNECIDFVHSWVTFLHFSTLDVVKSYLDEIYRVLNSGGIGIIYFPRLIRTSRPQTWNQVRTDIESERKHPEGFREGGPKSKVKSISIVISMWKMEEMLKTAGFTTLEATGSWSQEGKQKLFHGQHGIVFQKPAKVKQRRKRRRIKNT